MPTPIRSIKTADTQPIPTCDVIAALAALRYAVAHHMGFVMPDDVSKTDQSGVSVEFSPNGAGLIVGFHVRGHDEARDAEVKLRSLPGYTVDSTSVTPAHMRKLVRGYIQ